MINRIYNTQIIGTGSYAPEKIIKNEDLARVMDTSDEWIKTRTGICERRISQGENTSDIAVKAAVGAMKDANIESSKIDLIICATITPDYFTPSTACLVQSAIGARNAACFDISAACTGFIYALSTAQKFISTGDYDYVLVIGAETLSKIVDWNDRNTAVLFGDGAGALLLKRSEEKGLMKFYLGSDGDKSHALTCRAVPVKKITDRTDYKNNSQYIAMNGKEIFKFAVNAIEDIISKLMQEMNLSIDEIKYIIPHQANIRIIEAASKKLHIPIDKFYINLDKYGNTSAASIAIAMDEINRKKLVRHNDKLLIAGFGGGLTFGGALINWTKQAEQ